MTKRATATRRGISAGEFLARRPGACHLCGRPIMVGVPCAYWQSRAVHRPCRDAARETARVAELDRPTAGGKPPTWRRRVRRM